MGEAKARNDDPHNTEITSGKENPWVVRGCSTGTHDGSEKHRQPLLLQPMVFETLHVSRCIEITKASV